MWPNVCASPGRAGLAPNPPARPALHQQRCSPPDRFCRPCATSREQQPRASEEQQEEEQQRCVVMTARSEVQSSACMLLLLFNGLNSFPASRRPALYGEFVRRPLVGPFKRTAACRRCAGTGSVPCGQCGGSGRLARGGYHKRNPINAARIVGKAAATRAGWLPLCIITHLTPAPCPACPCQLQC